MSYNYTLITYITRKIRINSEILQGQEVGIKSIAMSQLPTYKALKSRRM